MARKKAERGGREGGSARKAVRARVDVGAVEDETIRRVSRTISTVEDFLAKWDAASLKPDSMFPHVARIRKFHGELVGWQRAALKAKGREGEESQIRRLHDFVVLCQTYS